MSATPPRAASPDPAGPLGALLRDEDVLLDVDAGSREELLQVIAVHFAARHHGLHAERIYDALAARERLGSTALGHGVALPHARLEDVREAAGVFVRTRHPIPFGAPDGKPVSLVLALLVPQHATEAHLHLLAAAAEAFASRSACDGLARCAAAAQARRILADPQAPGRS